MTVKELKEQLKKIPENSLVLVWDFGEGGTVVANELYYAQGTVTIQKVRTVE